MWVFVWCGTVVLFVVWCVGGWMWVFVWCGTVVLFVVWCVGGWMWVFVWWISSEMRWSDIIIDVLCVTHLCDVVVFTYMESSEKNYSSHEIRKRTEKLTVEISSYFG